MLSNSKLAVLAVLIVVLAPLASAHAGPAAPQPLRNSALCEILYSSKHRLLHLEDKTLGERVEILRTFSDQGLYLDIEHGRDTRYDWSTGRIEGFSPSGNVYLDGQGVIAVSEIRSVRVAVLPESMPRKLARLRGVELTFLPVDLGFEIKASGISQKALETLTKNGARLMDIYQFIDSAEDYHHAHLLGLDGDPYYRLVEFARLRDFGSVYNKLRLDLRSPEDADAFLDHVTSAREGAVFLVPRNFFSYFPRSDVENGIRGFTVREFEWLLENPEKLKNVTFVFGAYNFHPGNMFELASKDFENQALGDYKKFLLDSEDL